VIGYHIVQTNKFVKQKRSKKGKKGQKTQYETDKILGSRYLEGQGVKDLVQYDWNQPGALL